MYVSLSSTGFTFFSSLSLAPSFSSCPPPFTIQEIHSYVGASVRYFEVNAKNFSEVQPVFQETVAIPYINETIVSYVPCNYVCKALEVKMVPTSAYSSLASWTTTVLSFTENATPHQQHWAYSVYVEVTQQPVVCDWWATPEPLWCYQIASLNRG